MDLFNNLVKDNIYCLAGESCLNKHNMTLYPKLYSKYLLIQNMNDQNFDITISELTEDKSCIPFVLCFASEFGNIKLVKILSDLITNISYVARDSAALQNNPGNLQSFKFLTERFNMQFTINSLFTAAYSNNMDIIDYMIDRYPEMKDGNLINDALNMATKKGAHLAIEILRNLLDTVTNTNIASLSEIYDPSSNVVGSDKLLNEVNQARKNIRDSNRISDINNYENVKRDVENLDTRIPDHVAAMAWKKSKNINQFNKRVDEFKRIELAREQAIREKVEMENEQKRIQENFQQLLLEKEEKTRIFANDIDIDDSPDNYYDSEEAEEENEGSNENNNFTDELEDSEN